MPKTATITLTSAGSSNDPFSLFSDVDNYTNPFETGISKNDLLAGYTTNLIPDYTNIIRVKKEGCDTYTDIKLPCYSCDNCIDPFDTFLSGIATSYNDPNNLLTLKELFGQILDQGFVSDQSGIWCCPDCFRYTLASVETFLKYAEAVGLTQSAAVPA